MFKEGGPRFGIHRVILAGTLSLTVAAVAMSDAGPKADPKLPKHLDNCVFGNTFHGIEKRLPAIRRIIK